MQKFPRIQNNFSSSPHKNNHKKISNPDANQKFQKMALEIFNHDKFREQGYQIIDLLASYLERMVSGREEEPVLPRYHSHDLLGQWPLKSGSITHETLISILNTIIDESLHLHHPRYIGHQTASPLPLAALCQAINGLLNNAMGIFEMGPVHVVMEKRVIEWLCLKIGYDENSSGFLTSGGSLGNLTALLAARQIKSANDVWENGLEGQTNLAILVSDQTHYSAKRVMQIMGLSKKNIINVKTNNFYQINSLDSLETAYQLALKNNLKPIAIVGNACNTGPGTFDHLNVIADYCLDKNLWFHVDAAHGAATILAEKYKHLLAGIERADSITWDLHKLFLMPSLSTAILFKNNEHSCEAVKQDAPYLIYKNEAKKSNKNCWDENIKRTFECTKPSMALGLFLSLSYYGETFFVNFVTYTYDLAREFANYLEQDVKFDLLITPQSNIICFRYLPDNGNCNSNLLQERILQIINESGRFFIVKTTFEQKIYLRTTIMNPLTTIDDLIELINTIKMIGYDAELDVNEKYL